MTRLMVPAALLWVAAVTAAAAQDIPTLSVYVTDQNEDVFVALYGPAAVELKGCSGALEARALLQLPVDSGISETTLAVLEAEFGYGTHPRLPCASASFDLDWSATTPIWADLEGSGNYLIPALSGGGYYAVPADCTAIKVALAIRERLQLPGVLQGMGPPPDLGTLRLTLGCGPTTPVGPDDPDAPSGTAAWSLHRFETFLSEDSLGDTIYVARYLAAGENPAPAYLPILRVDGQATADLILAGGTAALDVEAKLGTLFGTQPEVPITALGAEAVSALRSALYADICLTDCAGYAHQHAAFLQPGIDLGVTPLPPLAPDAQLDRLGTERLSLPFADARSIAFTGCPALTAALGLHPGASADWLKVTATALAGQPPSGSGFDCRGGGAGTCIRRVPDSGTLTLTSFALGGDCAGAGRLRIELPALVQLPQALLLQGLGFAAVELTPAEGIGRSRLQVTPSRLSTNSASCILSTTEALIVANALPRLELHRIDMERKAGDDAGEVVALQVQGGTLVLDDVTIGNEGEGSVAVERGVNLCLADLYAAGGRITAETIALQGLAARVMVSGIPQARAGLARARYGLLLTSGSLARLHQVDVQAVNPVVLRGAELRASSVALTQVATGLAVGSAVQLERVSVAEFVTSTVAGFRCAVSFVDAASRLSFLLPGNGISRDNTHSACGPGQFSLIE